MSSNYRSHGEIMEEAMNPIKVELNEDIANIDNWSEQVKLLNYAMQTTN